MKFSFILGFLSRLVCLGFLVVLCGCFSLEKNENEKCYDVDSLNGSESGRGRFTLDIEVDSYSNRTDLTAQEAITYLRRIREVVPENNAIWCVPVTNLTASEDRATKTVVAKRQARQNAARNRLSSRSTRGATRFMHQNGTIIRSTSWKMIMPNGDFLVRIDSEGVPKATRRFINRTANRTVTKLRPHPLAKAVIFPRSNFLYVKFSAPADGDNNPRIAEMWVGNPDPVSGLCTARYKLKDSNTWIDGKFEQVDD